MDKKRKGNEYILYDDYAEIVIVSPKYGTYKTLIDLEDIEKCKKYTWKMGRDKSRIRVETTITTNKKTSILRLHRYIIGVSNPNQIIDHITGDTLDNRKKNLRTTDKKGNGMNKGLNSNNKSGIKGVHWSDDRGKWVASIKVCGKKIFLGYFNDKEEARISRREAEIKHFKEHSREYGKKYKVRKAFEENINNLPKEKVDKMLEQMIFISNIKVS